MRSVQILDVQLLASLAGPITNLQPFKVIQGNRLGANQKRIRRKFLLVINSKFGHTRITYHFQDIDAKS